MCNDWLRSEREAIERAYIPPSAWMRAEMEAEFKASGDRLWQRRKSWLHHYYDAGGLNDRQAADLGINTDPTMCYTPCCDRLMSATEAANGCPKHGEWW